MSRTKQIPPAGDDKTNLILQLKDMLSSLSLEEKQSILGIEIPKSDNSTNAAVTNRPNFSLGPRPNVFETSDEFNDNKNDSKIDKLLWGRKKPSKRKQRITTIQSTCTECGKEERVSKILTIYQEDTKKTEHTCAACLNKKKRQ